MMLSLRETAECIDISGNFSLLRDFYGYRTRSFPKKRESLRTQLELLHGKHINLDIVLVGLENDFDDVISKAISHARKVYKQVAIGIGRVKYYSIHTSDAEGHDVIQSFDEGRRMAAKWRGAFDDAIDVFIVRDYLRSFDGEIYAGHCWIIRCNKRHGCVFGMRTFNGPTNRFLGNLMAHELGHGLNLHHNKGTNNLMNKSSPSDSETPFLSQRQGRRMKRDCFARDGC